MTPTSPNSGLLAYGSNVTSEHGEDGIIARIFSIIGLGPKWCVELGALNGKHGSNVWQLVKNEGWSAVLLEADQTYFKKLQEEFAGMPQVHAINAFVSFEGEYALDSIFKKTPLPKEFDLFSLDIDGNDYHLWESLKEYRPRVMVVEFNPTIPNSVLFVQPRDMKVFQGSSLRALVELGKRKGYELVAANETNAFFVEHSLYPKFGITDNSIDALHTDTTYQTSLYQLYDGTLKIAGYDRFMWHNLPIDEARLQALPRSRRHYPARIASQSVVRTLKYHIRKLPVYPALMRIKRWLIR